VIIFGRYSCQKTGGGDGMREFTIELDEMVCKWLEHISEITGRPIEEVIADGIYTHMTAKLHQRSGVKNVSFSRFYSDT